MLTGYKTYIVAAAMAAATAAKALGWIDEAVFQTVMGLLGASGVATLRAGVAKAER